MQKRKFIVLCIALVIIILYTPCNAYHQYSSTATSTYNYRESIVKLKVYFGFFSPYIYKIAESQYREMNPKTNRLTFELYCPFYKHPYKTITYDYDRLAIYQQIK